ncbi:sensor histidine kinase [Leifsonia poae]|uniref:sensor histidine kinase n=1 Tax=Leifsonia poae TaxID=110933 RepID=UPI001CBC4B80|nr:histidine kinase [Leifsonia poae]
MNTSTPPSWWAFALNLIGGAAVAYGLLRDDLRGLPAWVLVVGFVALAAWMLRAVAVLLFGLGRLDVPLSVLAALAGALVAAPTNGIGVAPAAVAVLVLIGSAERSVLLGFGTALVAIALVPLGAVPFGVDVTSVLTMMGGLVLASFAGFSRRQFRESEAQIAQLREQDLAMREEKARVELLGQRQEIARDIHDVLAHSLGGLVVQLDAVEALLESGDVPSARRRVTDARRLAADGLGEARRAVAALRDPERSAGGEESVAPAALAASLDDLLVAHRSLGGVVDLTVVGRPVSLSRAQAAAVQRAAQEALSNVRKHAPGEPVRMLVDWQTDRMILTVSNPLADEVPGELAASGGGHGLQGMRERFAALPFGGWAAAGVQGDRFTVTAELSLEVTAR